MQMERRSTNITHSADERKKEHCQFCRREGGVTIYSAVGN